MLIAVIAPLRRATTLFASRVIVVVGAPLAPSIKGFEDLPQPTKVLAADGSLLGTVSGGEAREPIALKDLPDHVKHAALAAEDQNFYGHGGIDPEAVGRAALRNLTGGSEGGSTITQQLAKINYTGSKRTLFRKGREVLYALKLEQKYTKDELLERYLNQVYFGDGAYGISAAARGMFNVDPRNLSPAQAAMVLGRIRGPESRDPRTHLPLATARRNVVLKNMRSRGWLDKQEYEKARAEPIVLAAPAPAPGVLKAPHFVEFVKKEAARLDELGGSAESRAHRVVSGGLTLETTLDPVAYDAADASVRSKLGAPGDPSSAVVSVAPGDGAIRVLFGGLTVENKLDLASQGRRQTGSSFKPFVYLAALRAKIDPRSVFDGTSPRSLTYKGETYSVDNYEGESAGPITVDEALVHSVNTVFAQLVLQPNVGPAAVVQAATDAGIDGEKLERDRDRPSVALGGLTRGVSVLDMARAYATFAAKGNRPEPYGIVRVRDRNGKELYAHKAKSERAVDEQLAGVLNGTLIQVVQRGTGTAAQVPGWVIGGKTGTTQRNGDAWFIGESSALVTAVWVGHPDAIVPMTNVHGRAVTGGSYPAEIFSDVMKVALRDAKPEPLFTAPLDGLGLTIAGTTTTAGATTVPETTTVPTEPPPPATEPPPPPPPPSTTQSTTKKTTTTSGGSSTTATTSNKGKN